MSVPPVDGKSNPFTVPTGLGPQLAGALNGRPVRPLSPTEHDHSEGERELQGGDDTSAGGKSVRKRKAETQPDNPDAPPAGGKDAKSMSSAPAAGDGLSRDALRAHVRQWAGGSLKPAAVLAACAKVLGQAAALVAPRDLRALGREVAAIVFVAGPASGAQQTLAEGLAVMSSRPAFLSPELRPAHLNALGRAASLGAAGREGRLSVAAAAHDLEALYRCLVDGGLLRHSTPPTIDRVIEIGNFCVTEAQAFHDCGMPSVVEPAWGALSDLIDANRNEAVARKFVGQRKVESLSAGASGRSGDGKS
ncbi:MAG TPA: hypothetical protein VLJ86_18465 [Ramlibacter sp.]|nr:hypothetical protein [Ramlibacter sp.]